MRWISLAGSRDPPVCSQVFREWQPQQSAALMDYDISKYARAAFVIAHNLMLCLLHL